MPTLEKMLHNNGIIAVLEIENEADAVPTCEALLKGGVGAIELALRTPAAEPSIRLIKENVPQMCIGIGTIIKEGQASRVKALGADFGVSPGFNPKVVREAREANLPFAPGIATPSELEAALEEGCKILKFFPASQMGGEKYLSSMNNPYAYLNLKYIPLGGVSLENLAEWADNRSVISVGGTWIAKKSLILKGDFVQITKNALEATRVWSNARGDRE